jgi:hypothetical protein
VILGANGARHDEFKRAQLDPDAITFTLDQRKFALSGHQHERLEDYFHHGLIFYSAEVGMIHARHIIRP